LWQITIVIFLVPDDGDIALVELRNVMKKIIQLLLISVLVAVAPSIAKACEIVIAVDGMQKEKYKAGEIVVLKITVVLKHRNCDVSIDETAIRVSGSQVTAATKWVNTEGRTWEKRIKLKIVDDKSGRATITAERTCEKDGGKGSITLFTTS
jgi:hypothetical protein